MIESGFTMKHNNIIYAYRSVPGKRPPHGKRPGSHFRGMNGERPLPGKRPGILLQFEMASAQAMYLYSTSTSLVSSDLQRLNCTESPFRRSFLCHTRSHPPSAMMCAMWNVCA